jgi:hypothetical protein
VECWPVQFRFSESFFKNYNVCVDGIEMRPAAKLTIHLHMLLITAAAVIFPTNYAAWAQGIQRFRTYTQALNGLLVPEGKGASPDDPDVRTNCDLTNDPADLTEPGDDVRGRIGPNLSRHCSKPGNIIAGSILGGSLVSPQSTRTVSQFSLRPRQIERPPPAPLPKDPKKSPYLASDYWIGDPFERWLFPIDTPSAGGPAMLMRLNAVDDFPTGELRAIGDKLSLFVTYEHQRTDRDATPFESGFDSRHSKATIGFGYRATERILVGASGLYRRTDGDFDKTKTIAIAFDDTRLVFPYQQACGQPSGGEFNSDEFGGSIFTAARLGDAGFVAAEFGGAVFDQRYAKKLCLQHISDLEIATVYAGTLKGSPDAYRIDAQLRGGYDFVAGPLLVSPRAGLDFSWWKIAAYSENEVRAPGNSILMGGTPFPTGADLRYADQDFASLQSRLGLIVAMPLAARRDWIVTPFIEGTYIHEFQNEQRDIVARFVEDFRANPTRFSFKTDAPDRDFFELGGGINTQFRQRREFFFGGKAVLGNSLFDSFSVHAAIRLRF